MKAKINHNTFKIQSEVNHVNRSWLIWSIVHNSLNVNEKQSNK